MKSRVGFHKPNFLNSMTMNEHHPGPEPANIDSIVDLITGYTYGSLSKEQHNELDQWVAANDKNMRLFEELTDERKLQQVIDWMRQADTTQILKKLKSQLKFTRHRFSFHFFIHVW
jgi:hypothetical protein